MKTLALSLALFVNIFFGISQEKLEHKINRLVENELKKTTIHNAFLQVYSESKKININISKGNFKNGEELTTNNPFYTASIGKMFTASAIAILRDKGKLNFSDKIGKYLSSDILIGLHVIDSIDSSKEITIANLLQHTSGLPDYFEDTTKDGSPNVISELFMNPNKFWTPKECIQFTKEKMKPLFFPGKGYHYTDTEYVLLGLIIEEVSGISLEDFFKEFIFKPLEMQNTAMFLRSQPLKQTQKIAEFYVVDIDISTFKSISADWAGGGIVSTSVDLISFQRALFTGKIIKPVTFKIMKSWIPETMGMYYGFGLRRIVLNEISLQFPNLELIGHSGSTGSFLFYCPQLDIHIAGTLNQIEATKSALILISNILKEVSKI